MIQHASSLVCIDSTHCTTGCNFLLITVLVKDDYGEGVPVAWLLTNREDICALDPFFAELKLRVGNIEVVVVVVYFIFSRLLYLAFSANLGLLCMPHPGMGPLV